MPLRMCDAGTPTASARRWAQRHLGKHTCNTQTESAAAAQGTGRLSLASQHNGNKRMETRTKEAKRHDGGGEEAGRRGFLLLPIPTPRRFGLQCHARQNHFKHAVCDGIRREIGLHGAVHRAEAGADEREGQARVVAGGIAKHRPVCGSSPKPRRYHIHVDVPEGGRLLPPLAPFDTHTRVNSGMPFGRLASTLALLAPLALGAREANLTLLTAYPNAKCLDGSPGGYYYQPAASGHSAHKWVIHFQVRGAVHQGVPLLVICVWSMRAPGMGYLSLLGGCAYFRAVNLDVLLIPAQGGGECSNKDACQAATTKSLGSSKYFPASQVCSRVVA